MLLYLFMLRTKMFSGCVRKLERDEMNGLVVSLDLELNKRVYDVVSRGSSLFRVKQTVDVRKSTVFSSDRFNTKGNLVKQYDG